MTDAAVPDFKLDEPASLQSIWMIELGATRNPGVLEGPSVANIQLESGNLGEDVLQRYVFCHVDIGQSEGDTEHRFEFNCRWGLAYEANPDASEVPDDLGQWADRSSRSVAEPYIRQVLSDSLSRCGMPPLMLPLGAFQAVRPPQVDEQQS